MHSPFSTERKRGTCISLPDVDRFNTYLLINPRETAVQRFWPQLLLTVPLQFYN